MLHAGPTCKKPKREARTLTLFSSSFPTTIHSSTTDALLSSPRRRPPLHAAPPLTFSPKGREERPAPSLPSEGNGRDPATRWGCAQLHGGIGVLSRDRPRGRPWRPDPTRQQPWTETPDTLAAVEVRRLNPQGRAPTAGQLR
jgi:hypothetical protein